jgi:hypothetical protein
MADASYNAKIYRTQDSTSLVFSTGTSLVNENVLKSTAAATVANYGVSIIASTLPVTLSAPIKGCEKSVIFLATTGKKGILKTGSTAIFFNSSAGADCVITVTANTSKVSNKGLRINLTGGSTTQWWTAINGYSTVQHTVALAATT